MLYVNHSSIKIGRKEGEKGDFTNFIMARKWKNKDLSLDHPNAIFPQLHLTERRAPRAEQGRQRVSALWAGPTNSLVKARTREHHVPDLKGARPGTGGKGAHCTWVRNSVILTDSLCRRGLTGTKVWKRLRKEKEGKNLHMECRYMQEHGDRNECFHSLICSTV